MSKKVRLVLFSVSAGMILLLCGTFIWQISSPTTSVAASRDTIPAATGERSISHHELERMARELRGFLEITSASGAEVTSVAALATAAALSLSPQEALRISPHSPRIANGQEFFKGAQYVGAETCKECHARQYDEWRKTWHSRMEARPDPPNVIGDFSNREITYRNVAVPGGTIEPTVRASREGDKFYMTL